MRHTDLVKTLPVTGLSSLAALYEEADRLCLTPGWVPRPKPILRAEPAPIFSPGHWRFDDARSLLHAAGDLIGVEQAERRNLVMRNPAEGTNFETTRTLVCAYQMILPGEVAPSHRHSPHALRVILEGKGTYSIVNGEKMPMETGDVVLTPGWHWHGHGHDGDETAYWFDGLDVPLTHLLEPVFYEEHPDKYEPAGKIVRNSPFRFTFEQTSKELDSASANPDGFYGPRIVLAAPEMPSMLLCMERLEAGSKTRRYKSTANTVFLVVEGAGESHIGDSRFSWQFGDTFVAPTWTTIEHVTTKDSTLFVLSDEPLMQFLKYYRFQAD